MDGRTTPLPEMGGDPAKELCDRRFGIGGDGLILALPPQQGGDVRMQILNADGSEAEMCGNGIRGFARFLAELDGSASGTQWRVETPAGLMIPRLLWLTDSRVRAGPVLQSVLPLALVRSVY